MKRPPDDIAPDAPASLEEQAQAAALAQAMEQRPAETTPPIPRELADALETATLLAQASHAAMPEPGAVLDAVLPTLQARRPRRRRWLWPAIAVPATAAVLLLGTMTMMMRAPSPQMATSIAARPAATSAARPAVRPPPLAPPSPPLPLLRAQAELAHGDRNALATLDAEMRRYRASFYGSREGR